MTSHPLQLANVARPDLGSAKLRASAIAQSPAALDVWFKLMCFVLAGYAIIGRGVAYLGVPPLYAGELMLLAGLAVLLFKTHWDELLYSPICWLIAAFCGWGLLQTVPYLRSYGVEALRDAVMYGYSAFALIFMAKLITTPQQLQPLLRAYAWLTLPLVFIPPVMWYLGKRFGLAMPSWPWAPGVPVCGLKGGDVLAHVSGVLAFWSAYPDQVYSKRTQFIGLLVIGCSVVAIGSDARGGLTAFLVTFAICLAAKPSSGALWKVIGIGVVVVLLLGITDLKVKVDERDVSFDQISTNVESIIGGSKSQSWDGTKGWRLDWWNDIWDYTVNGRYFWHGKGYGVNLATDDGYQIGEEEDVIRSPHNAHMTVLARSGVPGFAIWLALVVSWFISMAASFIRARLRGEQRWAGLFQFLFAYCLAMTVNASFDIYLEGPLGGIWFWTVFGVGLAAMWLFRHRPELLHWNSESEAVT